MKKLATYEGLVENGRVTLPSDAEIPENTRVYVVVPAGDAKRKAAKTTQDSSDTDEISQMTKEKILEAWSAGKNLSQIAEAVALPLSTVARCLKQVQKRIGHIASPRLVHREQAKDFVLEVIKDDEL